MKKTMIFIQLMLAFGSCLLAESNMNDIWDDMSVLSNDLRGIWQKINPDCDFNKIEGQYLSNGRLMDACFDNGAEQILESMDLLYPIYVDYKALYLKTGEAIQKAKAARQKKDNVAVLRSKLEKCETRMNGLAVVAEKYKRKAKTDSLEIQKRHAISLYNDVLADRASYRDCFDNNLDLEAIWDRIDNKYCYIVALTPDKSNGGDAIFKIIITVGMLLMLYNIFGSKMKFNRSFSERARKRSRNSGNEVYTQQL